MIHAYDKDYLDDAMDNLGEAMDYAANGCDIDMDRFMKLFIASGFASQFAAGVPKVVSGLSGTELTMEVVRKSGLESRLPEPQEEYDRSPEYWCGWILAFYQWYTGRSFKDIHANISMSEILKLYPALHEAPEQKFVDVVNRRISNSKPPTRLQSLRKTAGYSQRELSEKSGVNLRTLQQYESRAKDIGKAAGGNLAALAKVLGCKMEDLLEYDTSETGSE